MRFRPERESGRSGGTSPPDAAVGCGAHHAPVAPRDAHGHGHCAPSPSDAVQSPPTAPGLTTHRPRQRRALAWCLAVTCVMMVAEVAAGLATGSLMLLSDAAHMAGHSVSLAVSYVAIRIAVRPPTPDSPYGLFRAEILASLFNSLGLFVLTGWIVYESIERMFAPVAVVGSSMILVATIGLVVNLVTAWILARSGAEDLNTKSALLHMLGDLFSSVVIVVGGIVLLRTGWQWLDPLLSLCVALVIARWAVGLFRSACSILLERAPEDVVTQDVLEAIASEQGVRDVHDLHVWEITTGYVCLTAHLVVDDVPLSRTAELCASIRKRLWDRFQVAHVTLQIEASAV